MSVSDSSYSHHLASSLFPQLNLKLKSLNFVSRLTHVLKVSFSKNKFSLKSIKLVRCCASFEIFDKAGNSLLIPANKAI